MSDVITFWHHWKGEPRLVRLDKENNYHAVLHDSYPTDEGYHFEEEVFTYEDGYIHRDLAYGGRDCDGEHGNYYHVVCPRHELDKGNALPLYWSDEGNCWICSPNIFRPKWHEESSEVYDQYARLAGY